MRNSLGTIQIHSYLGGEIIDRNRHFILRRIQRHFHGVYGGAVYLGIVTDRFRRNIRTRIITKLSTLQVEPGSRRHRRFSSICRHPCEGIRRLGFKRNHRLVHLTGFFKRNVSNRMLPFKKTTPRLPIPLYIAGIILAVNHIRTANHRLRIVRVVTLARFGFRYHLGDLHLGARQELEGSPGRREDGGKRKLPGVRISDRVRKVNAFNNRAIVVNNLEIS